MRKTNALIIILAFIPLSISSAQWVQTNWTSFISPNSFASYDQYLFAGTDGNGVFLSTDNGSNWNAVTTGLTNKEVLSLGISRTNTGAATIYAGTRGGVYLSTNNGTVWHAVNAGLTDTTIKTITVLHDNTSAPLVLAGTSSKGIFILNSTGTGWSERNNGLANKYIFCMASGDSTILAGTDGGGVYLSTDEGLHWSAMNAGITDLTIKALAILNFHSTKRFFCCNSNNLMYQSVNGINWQDINVGFPGGGPVKTFAVNGAYFFTGSVNGFSAYDITTGKWKLVNTGLSASGFNLNIIALAPNNAFMFLGTFVNGVWRRPLSELTLIRSNVSQPLSLSLSQNYPNPFNPSTTIEFSVPSSGRATVEIHNLIGQKIASLFDEIAVAGERYSINFSGKGLASGTYFYTLQYDNHRIQKKMQVVK